MFSFGSEVCFDKQWLIILYTNIENIYQHNMVQIDKHVRIFHLIYI